MTVSIGKVFIISIRVYLSLHFLLIIFGTSLLSFCILCFLYHEFWIRCHYCFCKCHLAICDFAPTWWKLSFYKNHIIKIWFRHILVKRICFQRGFELIKNYLKRKCGTVTKRNQKISLVKEIYKVKTWK